MRTVHHIFNNFLNNMQLLTIQDGKGLSEEDSESLQDAIRETAELLSELSGKMDSN